MDTELYTSSFEIFLVLIITLFYFIIASVEDLKKKEVYNYINYSYVFIIFFLGFFLSIFSKDILFFSKVVSGIIIGFFLGSLLFSMGLWGGGDAKFMMGFGGSFALLSQSLHSFILDKFWFQSLKISLSDYFFPLIYGSSIALIIISLITVIFLLILLFIRKNRNKLFRDGLILCALFLFQIFALSPNLIFELRIVSALFFILGIFIIPSNAFLNLGSFKKKSLIEIEKDIKLGKVWYLTKEIELENKEILTYEETSSGLSKHHIDQLKKYHSNKYEVEVVRPFSVGIIMTINLFVILLSFTYSSFFMVFDIFLHMIEFLLLSFTAGGILVILMVLLYIIRNFKLCILELLKKQLKYLILILLLVSILLLFTPFYLFSILALTIATALLFMFFVKLVEDKLFIQEIEISDLVPGDWIIQDIKTKSKTLFKKEDFTLGISEDQIKILKQYELELSKILVKSGIAFIPYLFIGFLVLFTLSMSMF